MRVFSKTFLRVRALGRIRVGVLLVIVASCVHSAPHVYGQYNDLAPKVAGAPGERIPRTSPSNSRSRRTSPSFSWCPGAAAGCSSRWTRRRASTSRRGRTWSRPRPPQHALSDTSRLARRPGNQPAAARPARHSGATETAQSGFSRDSSMGLGVRLQSARLPADLRVAAAAPYSLLATRVAGLSIPIDDDDALNTVRS